jgi:hypothetical protein
MPTRSIETGGSFEARKLSGGPGLSKAFPALNNPTYVAATAAEQTRPDDEIVGVFHKGQARAYPAWAASHYHIINDTLGGEPLLVDT